jgi:hypothetical protein
MTEGIRGEGVAGFLAAGTASPVLGHRCSRTAAVKRWLREKLDELAGAERRR